MTCGVNSVPPSVL